MEIVTDDLANQEKNGYATAGAASLPVEEFMKFVDETRTQPAFRASMDKCGDYYDGNQMTAEQLGQLDQMGFGSLMTNLIKPSIDTVLGLEAKNRTDFRCMSDDEQNQEVAEAMSAKLAEAERESRTDRACADAYASQVKSGLGWVHIGRNADPFLYPYKAESVHRREMYWDWSAKEADLGDARYVIRQKWFPIDQVVAALPQKAELLKASGGGWQPDWMQRAMENTNLMNAHDQETRMSMMAWEWRNIDERRVALQECWYARHVRGLVLRSPTGKVVEFNKRNPMHMAAVNAGVVKPEPAVYRKLRCGIWFGPHLLQDYDAGKNKLPYVPFWGFREDLTGVPYGLIRAMIPLQDEVNARRRKLMWLLSSKRVTMDSDALDQRFNEFADIVQEIARPDSMVIMNPARTNKDAMLVESDLALSHQQFEILQEAKEGIQAAAGIFNSIMGKTDGAKSGVAVNALVEQSSNTLGEINDNFKFSRQKCGELLVNLIREDLSGVQVQVMTGAESSRRKLISLNVPKIDQLTGQQYFENDTDRANFKVALEDVPSTPAYRAQQMMTIGETLKAMPPELQAAMMPFYVEATDLPKRKEMAKTLRRALGQVDENGEDVDPQVAQLTQQLQLVHQQSEEAMEKYEQAVQEAQTKAQQLTAENQMLKVQNANRGSELELKAQEIALKSSAATAVEQKQAAEIRVKEAEIELQNKQMELQKATLALAAAKQSHDAAAGERDHNLKVAELEHQQLSAVPAPVDSEAMNQAVEQKVTPLRDDLKKTKDDLQKRAELDRAREEGKREAEAQAKKDAEKQKAAAAKEEAAEGENPDDARRAEETHQANLKKTAAQTEAISSGSKAKSTETKAKVAAVTQKTKSEAKTEVIGEKPPPSAKPVKRSVTFKRDASGKLVGAEIIESP